jgi:hypothetical protein
MKLLITIVVLAGLLGAAASFFIFKNRSAPPMTSIPADAFTKMRLAQQAAASVAYTLSDATNTSTDITISLTDTNSTSTIKATLMREDPSLYDKSAYDKLKPGMKYPEVADILGGDLPKAHLADGFNGTFTVINGRRKIVLTFRNGGVEKKSCEGLD